MTKKMRVHYQIKSEETGTVLLRQRKIAKALRRWLRQNGFPFQYDYYIPRAYYYYKSESN
jgi:hypothetical protein